MPTPEGVGQVGASGVKGVKFPTLSITVTKP